jgi:P4 family phage/plasmid primase-like protien
MQQYKTLDKNDMTHTVFDQKSTFKLFVPDDKLVDFYSEYLNMDLSKVCITEKTCSIFTFFVDIDLTPDIIIDNDIDINTFMKIIVDTFIKVVQEAFGDFECVSAFRLSYKCHLVFPGLYVNKDMARSICKDVENRLVTEFAWMLNTRVIDTSVYSSGLRMIGCCKNGMKSVESSVKEKDKHQLYFPDLKYSNVYNIPGNIDIELVQLQKASILCPLNTSVSITLPTYKIISCEKRQTTNTNTTNSKRIRTDCTDVVNSFPTEFYTILEKSIRDVLLKHNLTCPEQVNCVELEAGVLRIDLPPQECPCAHRMHRRTSERNIPANYLLLTAFDWSVRCWKCTDIFEMQTPPDELLQYLESACPDFSLKNSLYKQTHEIISEYIFSLVKNSFAVSPTQVNFTWFSFCNETHHWVRSEKITSVIMNVKGLVQRSYLSYVSQIRSGSASKEIIDATNELWKNLQKSLQTTHFVRGGILPLVARKLDDYWCEMSKCTSFQSALDQNPSLMCFSNGVYDFNTHVFKNGSPLDFISMTTGTPYIPYEEYQESIKLELDSFLDSIFTNHQHLKYILQQIALSMNGTNKTQSLFIFTGAGANGKSTLVRLLNSGLGDYAGEVNVTLFTHPRPPANAPAPELIQIKGKRFVTCSEPNGRESFNLGTVKWLTGGDRITAAAKYENNQSFYLQSTFFVLTNDIPQINASFNDFGTWRRIKPCEFSSRFVENSQGLEHSKKDRPTFLADPNISNKLDTWKNLFISRLVDVSKQVDQGLEIVMPEDFLKLWRKLQSKNDIYSRFIDEYIIPGKDDDDFTSITALWITFGNWKKSFKHNNPVSFDVFEQHMINRLGPIKFSADTSGWFVSTKTIVGLPAY